MNAQQPAKVTTQMDDDRWQKNQSGNVVYVNADVPHWL
jgi:quercetin dioxygenase-like cupin family protein